MVSPILKLSTDWILIQHAEEHRVNFAKSVVYRIELLRDRSRPVFFAQAMLFAFFAFRRGVIYSLGVPSFRQDVHNKRGQEDFQLGMMRPNVSRSRKLVRLSFFQSIMRISLFCHLLLDCNDSAAGD